MWRSCKIAASCYNGKVYIKQQLVGGGHGIALRFGRIGNIVNLDHELVRSNDDFFWENINETVV